MSDLHSFVEPLEVIDGMIASWPGYVQVLVAGDILSGGVSPVETLEWVRTHAGEFAVLGNHDEGSLRGVKVMPLPTAQQANQHHPILSQ